MAGNGKNTWALFLMILSGIVVGGFLGYLAKDVSFLSWLNFGQEFGVGTAKGADLVRLNLGIITITFGITIKITIAGIIGMFAAILLYRRM